MEQLMTFKLLFEVIFYLTLIAGLIIGAIIIVVKKIGATTESLIETHCNKQREKDLEKRHSVELYEADTSLILGENGLPKID